MGKYVHIRIKADTAERLKALGRMGDTYDDVIRRLIEEHEKMERGRVGAVTRGS